VDQKKLTFGLASKYTENLRTLDAKNSNQRDWRLPTSIEAFAIASAMIDQKTVAQISFWAIFAGRPAVLTFKRGQPLIIDQAWEKPETTREASVIAVHN
jgi:hypothetical protein